MPRKSEVPLVKRTINLREGDDMALRTLFPRHKYQAVIRRLVSHFIDNLQSDVSNTNVNVDVKNLDIED